jgi:hypothetical protein
MKGQKWHANKYVVDTIRQYTQFVYIHMCTCLCERFELKYVSESVQFRNSIFADL